jgi:inosose dehydratase
MGQNEVIKLISNFCSCPGSWGIEDPKNPENTPWEIVLDQISSIGFNALELGPYGYLPLDAGALTEELRKRNLQIVAGTLYDDLISEDSFQRIVAKTHEICKVLASVPTASPVDKQKQSPPYYVIIDAVKTEREKLPRLVKASKLSNDLRQQMVSHIKEIAKISYDEYGVRSVIHHHAGGYIDYVDEIDMILSDISNDYVGLCFDTGHAYYAGFDPAQCIRRYGSRIEYVHFKDIDKSVYDAVLSENIGFYEACFRRLMCPIGEGTLDYSSIRNALIEIDYHGWITLEQDRHPNDTNDVTDCIEKSLTHLRKLGY